MSRFKHPGNWPLKAAAFFLATLLTVTACSGKKESITAQQATVDLSLLQTLPEQPISYNDEVRPVLERRCVVCHGCYEAPSRA